MTDGPHYSGNAVQAGTRLNDIYEIEFLVATGGMGEVYKGHTIHTGDPVAIKLMRPEFADNEAALALFRKEASALHTLHHDAIIRYYVCSVDPALKRPYLAMEFMSGESLSDLLRRGPLPLEAVWTLKQRLASGLQAAHERGIIHRDVASDNVVIPDGNLARAKIIDFGIARSLVTSHQTVIGSGFAGKYNYVSPEQLGLFGGDVTAKSDIYSLGLVLVEALRGQAIDMSGTQFEVIEKRRVVPDLAGLDPRIRPLLERMLQPDPQARPADMAEVAAWGMDAPPVAARASTPVHGSRPVAPAPPRRAARRWRYATLLLLLLLLLCGGGVAWYLLQLEPPPAEPAVPELKSAAVSPPSEVKPAPPEKTPLQRPPRETEKTQAAPDKPPQDSSPQTEQLLKEETRRKEQAREKEEARRKELEARQKEDARRKELEARQKEEARRKEQEAKQKDLEARRKDQAKPKEQETQKQQEARLKEEEDRKEQEFRQKVEERRREAIARYIMEYEGGDCFYAKAVDISSTDVRIEGYGVSAAPFQALDAAFKRDIGVEPDIGVRAVTRRQCAAVTFLGRLRTAEGHAPQLRIGDTPKTSAQALTGSIDNPGARHIELLLVSDAGSVYNVTDALQPGTQSRAFSVALERAGANAGQPQLLLAVVSARPLQALKQANGIDGDQIFPLILNEAAKAGQALAATARYVRLAR